MLRELPFPHVAFYPVLPTGNHSCVRSVPCDFWSHDTDGNGRWYGRQVWCLSTSAIHDCYYGGEWVTGWALQSTTKSTVQVPSWAWMAYPAGWRSWSRQMRAVRVAVPKGLYFANVPIWATNDGRRLWVNVRELRDCERHSHGTVCEKNSRRVVGTLWAEQRSAEGTSFDGCVVVDTGNKIRSALTLRSMLFVRKGPSRERYARVAVGTVKANSIRTWGGWVS